MGRRGELITNNVHLQDHEYNTVELLLDSGYNIELIPPLKIKGTKTADVVINGVMWEMKAPTGNGKNVIRHNIQHASHQSNNIIIDLRRCKMPENQAIKEIETHFNLSKRLRHVIIIKNNNEILDISK